VKSRKWPGLALHEGCGSAIGRLASRDAGKAAYRLAVTRQVPSWRWRRAFARAGNASPTPPAAPSILRRVPCGLRTDQAGRAILLERLPGARLSTAKGSQDGGGREICRPCRLPHRITPPKAGQGPHRARPGVRLASARPARRSGFRSQCCYLRSRHLSRGLRRPERRGRRASARTARSACVGPTVTPVPRSCGQR
jgi:hypothetical protein